MSKTISKILIGADPEFGVFDKKINRLVSAHDLIPGTKNEPHKVNGGAIQVDGLMVEINIDPAETADQFISNKNKVLAELRKWLPEDRYNFIFEPVIVFDPGYFDSLPEEVKMLGCSPDFDAWHSGGINPPPEPIVGLPSLRTCSGHIHIGWTSDADVTDISHLWDCRTVVRLLDCSLYEQLLKKADKDFIREKMYGKLGSFRPKSYGVEWRVPSNWWMKSDHLTRVLFDAVKSRMQRIINGDSLITHIPQKMTPVGDYFFYADTVSKNIQRGARIAPTSGTVNYDLDLDVPFSVGGKYLGPPTLDSPLIIV